MGVWIVASLSAITGFAFYCASVWGDFVGWRYSLLLSTWSLASVWAMAMVWRGQPKCWLSWNGHVWQVLSLLPSKKTTSWNVDCTLEVHLDLQKNLLVSVSSDAGFRQWFWVSQSAFPDRWHGFRCAVYSRSTSIPFY